MAVHTTSGTLNLKGGLVGAWRRYTPDAPRAVVLVVHGHGEHSGRYTHVAEHLTSHGLAVHALDLRGHGLSGGGRGHVMAWSDYDDDVASNLASAREAFPGLPWFLLGHSMGGLVAVHYCQTRTDALPAALIVSNPLLQVAFEVPKVKALLGNWLSDLWPTLALPTGLDANGLSHDRAVIDAYKSDPLVHDKASTRWFTSMTGAMARAQESARSMKLPTLVIIGEADPLVAAAGSHRFFDALGSSDKVRRVWPHMFHEPFNEPDKAEPLAAVSDFILARLPGS